MWVARDKDGELVLYKGRPVRGSLDKDKWVSFGSTWENFTIDESLFPSLKWEDEPLEVDLVEKTHKDDIVTREIQCDCCDKTFTYLPQDVISFKSLGEDYKIVICPNCKSRIFL